jgi:DNA-binding transcriptional MocR family regulator
MQNHQIRFSVREGLHFWVPVQDEALALQVFSTEGIAVQSGQAFRIRTSKAIRISVAHLTGDKIPQIADLTAKAIKGTSQTVL